MNFFDPLKVLDKNFSTWRQGLGLVPGVELFFLPQLAHGLSCTHTYVCLSQATSVYCSAGSGWFFLMTHPFSLLKSTQTRTLLLILGVTAMGTTYFSTLDMTPASNISVKLFFCLLIQGEWYFPWNWHLEGFGIVFECDTVTGLYDTWPFDQLKVLVCYFTLVVSTVQAVESAY